MEAIKIKQKVNTWRPGTITAKRAPGALAVVVVVIQCTINLMIIHHTSYYFKTNGKILTICCSDRSSYMTPLCCQKLVKGKSVFFRFNLLTSSVTKKKQFHAKEKKVSHQVSMTATVAKAAQLPHWPWWKRNWQTLSLVTKHWQTLALVTKHWQTNIGEQTVKLEKVTTMVSMKDTMQLRRIIATR